MCLTKFLVLIVYPQIQGGFLKPLETPSLHLNALILVNDNNITFSLAFSTGRGTGSLVPRPLFPFLFVVATNKNRIKQSGNETKVQALIDKRSAKS